MMRRVRIEDRDGTGCSFFCFSSGFRLGWYYQPRLKGCAQALASHPFSLSSLVPVGHERLIPSTNRY
jgi:hypothetical protein